MTKILSILSLLSLVAGCANHDWAAFDASQKGDHASAAKHYLRAAKQNESDEKYKTATPSSHDKYCRAASEFLKVGGKENVRNAIDSATKGSIKAHSVIQEYQAKAPYFRENVLRYTRTMFICKFLLAKARLSIGDHEGVRELVKDYTDLDAERALYVLETWSPEHVMFLNDSLMELVRSHDSRLADAVENHFRSSSLAVAEQQKQDAAIRQARKAEDARAESIQREQAALEAEAKRERAAREAQARTEYERQHPEIARAKQAQAAAEKQYAACKSSCSSQSLGCIAACFGNLEDTMCSGRCQVALNTCENGCAEQRDALMVQAGGTPLGTSSSGSAALLQGLVTMGDSLAAAKGLPSSGASGFATPATPSMQTSMASFAQALSALAGSAVVAPSSKRSSSPTAKAEGTPSASGGSTCDVSAEDREIEAMERKLPSEVKGMGKKKRECYAAKQYVKIAHFQIRAATRCNLDLAEPTEYLHDAEVQEREFCRDLSMK